MKISEETGDSDMKEQAKVNFGMANASMKWTNHVTNILQNLQQNEKENNVGEENDSENEGEEEDDNYGILPEIKQR